MLNTKQIEIDPIKINDQIEEIKEIYEDLNQEFTIIAEEYKNINYQENPEIKEINHNLEKTLDLLEIYTLEIKNKNEDAIYNVGNIKENYQLNKTKNKETINTIANLISLKNHLEYYNSKLIIWNILYKEKIEEKNQKTKTLQKEIEYNITQLIKINQEVENQIIEIKYQIKDAIKENKLLEAKIDTKTLETYTYFKNKTINKKQEKIKTTLEDLAEYIEKIKTTTEPLDYILDVLKNNIDWTKQLKQIITKTKQTLQKHNYQYLNENLNKKGEKYKNQIEYTLNGYLIPEKNILNKIIKTLQKNSKEKNKSELIQTLKTYQKQIENIIIEIENLLITIKDL